MGKEFPMAPDFFQKPKMILPFQPGRPALSEPSSYMTFKGGTGHPPFPSFPSPRMIWKISLCLAKHDVPADEVGSDDSKFVKSMTNFGKK